MLDPLFFKRIKTRAQDGCFYEVYEAIYARSTMILFSRETKTPLAALTLRAEDGDSCLSMLTGRPSPEGASEPYFQGMLNKADQVFHFTISNLSDEGWINFNILHTPHRVSNVDPGPAYGVNTVNELHPNQSYTIHADQRTSCEMILKGKTQQITDCSTGQVSVVALTVKDSEETKEKPGGLYFYLSVVPDKICPKLVEKFSEGTIWKVAPGFVRRLLANGNHESNPHWDRNRSRPIPGAERSESSRLSEIFPPPPWTLEADTATTQYDNVQGPELSLTLPPPPGSNPEDYPNWDWNRNRPIPGTEGPTSNDSAQGPVLAPTLPPPPGSNPEDYPNWDWNQNRPIAVAEGPSPNDSAHQGPVLAPTFPPPPGSNPEDYPNWDRNRNRPMPGSDGPTYYNSAQGPGLSRRNLPPPPGSNPEDCPNWDWNRNRPMPPGSCDLAIATAPDGPENHPDFEMNRDMPEDHPSWDWNTSRGPPDTEELTSYAMAMAPGGPEFHPDFDMNREMPEYDWAYSRADPPRALDDRSEDFDWNRDSSGGLPGTEDPTSYGIATAVAPGGPEVHPDFATMNRQTPPPADLQSMTHDLQQSVPLEERWVVSRSPSPPPIFDFVGGACNFSSNEDSDDEEEEMDSPEGGNLEQSLVAAPVVEVGSTQAAELQYGSHVDVGSGYTGHDYAYEHTSEPTVLCMSIWTGMKFLALPSLESELNQEIEEWIQNRGKELVESLNAIYKSDKCVIDLESEADTIICTCGHQCINHANAGMNNNGNLLRHCPLCRSPITAFVKADGIVTTD